ncbi:solute carrier organic anion transporter family member 1C1-like isoform X2 [Artemia franciscana]|uniref:solute carrier organic anion transporter family member 1C1-like isoform X2 n=1 Tax=Artemia franciscana TaxID=6661 RepID=UPI0032DB3F1F
MGSEQPMLFRGLNISIVILHIVNILGCVSSLRLLGPTAAYIMASGFLKMYVNLNETPALKPTDPQWIGAWWLGFIIIGSIIPVLALVMALFPKKLPTPTEEVTSTNFDSEKEVIDLKEHGN